MYNLIKKLPFDATFYTLMTLVLGTLGFLLALQGNYCWLPVFALAFLIDVIDGKVALAKGQLTEKGVLWDLVLDRFNEALLIFAVMLNYPYLTLPLSVVLFFGTLLQGTLVAYLRAAFYFGEISILPKLARQVLLLLGAALAPMNAIWAYNTVLVSAGLSLISFVVYFVNISSFLEEHENI